MTAVTALLVRKSSKQSWSQAGHVDLLDSPASLEEKLESLNEGAGFAKYKVGETVELAKAETEQSVDFNDAGFQARVDAALDQVGGAPVELEAN
jgi:hypothetical protein